MATLAEVKTSIESKLPSPGTTWIYAAPQYVAQPPRSFVIMATAITADTSEETAAAHIGIPIHVLGLGSPEEYAWIESVPTAEEVLATRFKREAEAKVRAAQHAGTYRSGHITTWCTTLSCYVEYVKANGQLELTVLYFDPNYVLQEGTRSE